MTDEPETNETGAAYSNYSDMYAVAEFDTLGEAYKRIYELTRELQKETPDWQPFGWRGDYVG